MKKMASSICHRGWKIKVRYEQKLYHWTIVELLAVHDNDQIAATETSLQQRYATSQAALAFGHIEGRRLIDERLGPAQ
ncbi:hypothetical protein [Herbaspirillum robiniae]|uniref:hypothetical protein n=1 Tax=Herbaspirillum robiniae TaxID=2014887 RepID=UPI00101AD606|nr:hypothetical protein [Herbaspirillum robiniae]